MTFLAQNKSGAVVKMELMPLAVRSLNGCGAYFWYVQRAIWPTGLGAYYPYPREVLVEPALVAGGALAAITIAALVLIRRAPYLVMGWFWFLGMLVPVIGVVQVGN